MRRRRQRFSTGGATKRRKKIVNPVRVKERIAKKGGRCSGCRARYEPGTPVTVVNIRRRTYHTGSCVPANVGAMPGSPIVVSATPEAVVKALSSSWSLGESRLVAMMSLENALIAVAKTTTITPEMEKSFEKYNKIKERALRPGTDGEGAVAARMAILELCKLVF